MTSVVDVPEQHLAAARGLAGDNIGAAIFGLLDLVWPFVRERELKNDGHNIVVYRCPLETTPIEAGVRVFEPFDGSDSVHHVLLPACRAVTAAHIGPYDRMSETYEPLHAWAREQGLSLSGLSWELYGHWTDDATKLRTDIFLALEE